MIEPKRRRPTGYNFGPAIRRARQMRGLQSHELAELLSVTRSLISQWENSWRGKQPGLANLERIAAVLAISMEDLIDLADAIPGSRRAGGEGIVNEDRLQVAWRRLREAALDSSDAAVINALRDFGLAWAAVATHEAPE